MGQHDESWLNERKCFRKRGWWRTKKAAHKRARQIYMATGLQLYPYRCGACGLVHLTKDSSVKGKGVI